MNTETLELKKYIDAGHQLHYAPVAGGVVSFDPASGHFQSQPIAPFLELRRQCVIEFAYTMRQGHGVFHGRVDVYKGVPK